MSPPDSTVFSRGLCYWFYWLWVLDCCDSRVGSILPSHPKNGFIINSLVPVFNLVAAYLIIW